MATNDAKSQELVGDALERPHSEKATQDITPDEMSDEPVELVKTTTEEYPHGGRLAVLVVSLLLSMFLVALDNVSDFVPSMHPD